MRALLLISLWILGGSSCASPTPLPSLLDDPKLVAAVAGLRDARKLDPWLEAPPGLVTPKRLRALIEAGGDDLNQAALAALTDSDPERLIRAGLVLQTLPQEDETYERLAKSENLQEWALAVLAAGNHHLREQPEDQTKPIGEEEALEALGRASHALRDLLSHEEQELEGYKEEYVHAVRTVLHPNLEDPLPHVTELQGCRVDLSGDGLGEWCLLGTFDDGWNGVQFLIVLDGESGTYLRGIRFDQRATSQEMQGFDVDGDGRSELLVTGRWISKLSIIWLLDLDWEPERTWLDRIAIAIQHPLSRHVWFATGGPWNASNHGTAFYLQPAYGGHFTLERVDDSGQTAQELEVLSGIRAW